MLVSNQEQKGDSSQLKVPTISRNVTAAVLHKHFKQIKKTKKQHKHQ